MSKLYKYDIDGQHFEISVEAVENGVAEITVNGERMSVSVEEALKAEPDTVRPVHRTVKKAAEPHHELPAAAAPQAAPAGPGDVRSPLPGVVIQILVTKGQEVRKGQKLAVLEAMKMENDIMSGRDGVVTEVLVKTGDSVLEDAVLMTIG